jgi:hypothetical protein
MILGVALALAAATLGMAQQAAAPQADTQATLTYKRDLSLPRKMAQGGTPNGAYQFIRGYPGPHCKDKMFSADFQVGRGKAVPGMDESKAVSIPSGQRLWIFAYTNQVGSVRSWCQNMVSFVPTPGAHYELTQLVDSFDECFVKIVGDDGKAPYSLERSRPGGSCFPWPG